ncbi:Mob1/phocein [Thermothelomyces heterothallicus CBS 202.75]|uniref:Mob1/phocein n=1 Tax=Thermothelomyces heterothallicus CBS 202.75 TaxID=1149848 RepID=UPI003743D3F8
MSLPPSSPRLPSPPPPAEIQIGPKSPLMGANAARQTTQMEQTAINVNAKRRIHPGTKAADMAAGPPLVPLHELDSAFQLQEHLAALHYHHTASHTTPINRDTAELLAAPPAGVDKTLWLYELCRFLIAQCNTLIVGFLFDTPPCSAATCPEMRAGEWQFLCAVHDAPKSCCAIDYCCHTLDWATNVVTNPKIFPSRFVVDAHDSNTAVKNLINIFRRLHRVFAHAWFQHRGVFWSVESQSGLYVFFKTVCDIYDLLPAENYKLPPEAEGLDDGNLGVGDPGDRSDRRQQQHHHQPMGNISIAKPPARRAIEDVDYSGVNRTNTRRHIKSSPSTGSAVTTVPEADEDDSSDLSHRLRGMRISGPSGPQAVPEEDRESANIPVMVEHRPHLATSEQPNRPSSVVPPPGTAAGGDSEPKPAPGSEVTKQAAAEPEAPVQTQSAAEPETRPEPDRQTEQESGQQDSEPASKTKESHPLAPVPDEQQQQQQPQELEAQPGVTATAEGDAEPMETEQQEVEDQEAASALAAGASTDGSGGGGGGEAVPASSSAVAPSDTEAAAEATPEEKPVETPAQEAGQEAAGGEESQTAAAAAPHVQEEKKDSSEEESAGSSGSESKAGRVEEEDKDGRGGGGGGASEAGAGDEKGDTAAEEKTADA